MRRMQNKAKDMASRRLPKASDAEDAAYKDAQRDKYCAGPAFPGSPKDYTYVPARCVRARPPSKSGTRTAREPQANRRVLAARLRAEEQALSMLADNITLTLKARGGSIDPSAEMQVYKVGAGILTHAMTGFVDHVVGGPEQAGKASDAAAGKGASPKPKTKKLIVLRPGRGASSKGPAEEAEKGEELKKEKIKKINVSPAKLQTQRTQRTQKTQKTQRTQKKHPKPTATMVRELIATRSAPREAERRSDRPFAASVAGLCARARLPKESVEALALQLMVSRYLATYARSILQILAM